MDECFARDGAQRYLSISLSSSARTSRSLGIAFRRIQRGSNPVGNEQVFPFQMRDVNQTERMHFVRKVSSLRRRNRRRRQIVFAFPTTSPESKSYIHSCPSACGGELSCVYLWNSLQEKTQPGQPAVLATAKASSRKAR